MDEASEARRLHASGQVQAAGEAYRRALEAAPTDHALRRDFAALLLQGGRPEEAIPLLRTVVDAGVADARAATLLALALRGRGDVLGGREAASRALAIAPRDPLALLAAGSLAVMAGDAAGAERVLAACVALEPRLYEAWHWLGEALQAQQRWTEAAAAYRRAMAGRPAEAINVGICAERAGELAAARAAYLQAHAAQPARADVLVRLAQVEALACRFEDSARHAAAAAERLQSDAAPEDDRPEPFPLAWLGTGGIAMRHALRRQTAHVQARDALAGPAATMDAPRPASLPLRGDDHRIRIAYLSPDLGPHAVGTLLAGHFAAHDRARFRVHAYSLRRHEGPVADAIRRGCDAFVDCEGWMDHAVAERIRRDAIDVLIDLGGYTAGARPGILAMRPCALQLGWLGFIHAQEAPWLDGLVLDRHVQPEHAPWPWSDRVLRLDTLMLPAGPMPRGRADRASSGLPEGVPLLASFNNSYKLDEPLVRAWVRILQGAPEAHLLVYLPDAARDGFLSAWARLGGARDRLHTCGHVPAAPQADRAAGCDLFLDAFRYQAGATGIAAAAAGLPLLSMPGTNPLARLGAALDDFLGLDELVCADPAEYIDKAIALARDPTALAALRHRLRDAVDRSGLLDPRRVAAAIERLVETRLGEATRA